MFNEEERTFIRKYAMENFGMDPEQIVLEKIASRNYENKGNPANVNITTKNVNINEVKKDAKGSKDGKFKKKKKNNNIENLKSFSKKKKNDKEEK